MASDPTCLHYSQLNQGFNEILDLVTSISATACNGKTHFVDLKIFILFVGMVKSSVYDNSNDNDNEKYLLTPS